MYLGSNAGVPTSGSLMDDSNVTELQKDTSVFQSVSGFALSADFTLAARGNGVPKPLRNGIS